MLTVMKTRESKKVSLAETNNTTELQGAKQCNLSSGLTQQMNNLIIDDNASRFQVPPKTTIFYPDKKDKLYQISVIEHHLGKTKIRYDQWGPNFDEMVCSKSIWAYSQFTPLLSKVKKIPRDLAKRIDEIVQSASSPNLATTDINLNELPDLETISSKHIPTLRFIPVKFRVRWSELLTSVIDACISLAQSIENWKKLFAISKCVLRASNRGGKKHKQQQEKQLLSRLE